jgi:hypothetical protein
MPQRSSRNHKIEPLDYAEMAQAPALKGAVSFLDITPNDVQSGFARFGMANPTSPEFETSPVDVSSPGAETVLRLRSSTHGKAKAVVTPIKKSAGSRSGTAGQAPNRTIAETTAPTHIPDVATDVSPPAPIAPAGDISGPATVTGAGVRTTTGHVAYPGDETPSGYATTSISPNELTPGRGRSKVRRCVLAQDGHSLGEEAIYQVLWRGGRPESADPNSSRTVRMGAADVGIKVNMAKKNVRQNISKLYDKLALEILEDFETMSSQARLYRIFSYKQILERRRAAGLEYVLRNKGVVFCSRDGAELVTSPAYVKTPGDETSIRPAPPKKRRVPLPADARPAQAPLPPAEPVQQSEDADLLEVSQALNRYWPVDQPAAVQLIRACRKVRPDARADEIAFFVREKLELARQNRSITNPTGLILSTVPQSFVGSTFLDFRKRIERQAALAAEEAERKLKEEEELKAWFRKEYEAAERIANDESKSQKERDAAERTMRQLGPQNY